MKLKLYQSFFHELCAIYPRGEICRFDDKHQSARELMVGRQAQRDHQLTGREQVRARGTLEFGLGLGL